MPNRQRITFQNQGGERLAAALELPDGPPRAFALFAHCFTCGKDIAAASRISRTLAAEGIAVLRFDFTGLGSSEGDFANSNFSSNVDDLVAAANHLRREHQAPELLIGHSLGGTAVLAAAPALDEVRAVVIIGAPASPEHVVNQFSADVERIAAEGDALVNLAGREFRIRQQFVDDLKQHPVLERLGRLRKALLVMHAPLDEVVAIQNATDIFSAARHPKSFLSLDGADHLVSRLADAQYVATTIAAWASRYLPTSETPAGPAVAGGSLWVGEGNPRFLRQVRSDDHSWVADEPKKVGGDNLGPDPYEHLLAALGTCTSMTLRMYANHREWPLEDVSVWLSHSREHKTDCEGCEESPQRLEVLRRRIELKGPLTAVQRERLLAIADRCPVHRTLEGELRIETELFAREPRGVAVD